MESKHWIQSIFSKLGLRTADKVVIILCFAGTVVSLCLFWADLFTTVRNKNATPLGMISYKYNTAQRRLADRVLWDRLRKKSPIYNGDVIRTADLSEATIRFSGGREMDLTENTIIRIRVKDGSTEIDLSGGELNLGAGTDEDSIVLSMGDQKIEAGSDAVISAVSTAKKGKAVQVSSGKAVFVPAKGAKGAAAKAPAQTITAGSSVSLDSNNKATVTTGPTAVVTYPLPNAKILVQDKSAPAPVPFTWNRVNVPSTEPLRMELSQNKIFSQNNKTVPVSGSNATVDLPPGTWYWQIKQESGEVLASGRVTVLTPPVPSLISPVRGYTYQYRLKPPSVKFQWAPIEDAIQYQVEAANNAGFSNPKINIKVRGTSLDNSSLTEGTWYWRVTPIYSNTYQGKAVSSSSSFHIERNNDLKAPSLIGPETGASVSLSADKGVYFSWKQENEAEFYTIQIAKNQDMSGPVIKEKIKKNVYVYQQKEAVLNAGNYYWAVSQTDIAGNESPYSRVQSFSAVLAEAARRPLFPPDNYVIADSLLPEIRFTWKSDFNSNARFQVSKTAAFTAMAVNEKVLGDSFRGKPLPAGTYYWRVIGDADKQASYRQFTVVPPLAAPAVQSPPPGGQVVLKGDAEAMVLRWNPVNKAEQYLIRIYSAANRRNTQQPPLHEQTVSTTMLRLPSGGFSNGAYAWTIQAFAEENDNATRLIGLTGEQQFSLRKLYPVRLDSPETNAELKGTAILYWSTADTIGKSRLVLTSASNAPVLEILNPSKMITLNDLKEGVYYWSIIAQTADGFDISAATPRRFRLSPNLLPEPLGRSPAADTVIGPEALRTSQQIVFSCDPVEGADGYIFTVFRNTGAGRQQLLQTQPQIEPSWALEDLRTLGEGDFIWQVEAVTRGDGKTKMVRGQTGENSFRMDVPVPNKVQILEAGIMYGN